MNPEMYEHAQRVFAMALTFVSQDERNASGCRMRYVLHA